MPLNSQPPPVVIESASVDNNPLDVKAKIRLEASCERGFLHALVDLEQMGMSFAHADPDNFRRAFRGKGSDACDGEKERAKLNGAEFFAQRNIGIVRNITEKTERQMNLLRVGPAHAANVRVKTSKQFAR